MFTFLTPEKEILKQAMASFSLYILDERLMKDCSVRVVYRQVPRWWWSGKGFVLFVAKASPWATQADRYHTLQESPLNLPIFVMSSNDRIHPSGEIPPRLVSPVFREGASTTASKTYCLHQWLKLSHLEDMARSTSGFNVVQDDQVEMSKALFVRYIRRICHDKLGLSMYHPSWQ